MVFDSYGANPLSPEDTVPLNQLASYIRDAKRAFNAGVLSGQSFENGTVTGDAVYFDPTPGAQIWRRSYVNNDTEETQPNWRVDGFAITETNSVTTGVLIHGNWKLPLGEMVYLKYASEYGKLTAEPTPVIVGRMVQPNLLLFAPAAMLANELLHDFNILLANLESLKNVSENIETIIRIDNDRVCLLNLCASMEMLKRLEASIGNIDIVGEHMDNVDTVANIHNNVNTVALLGEYVEYAAENIEDIIKAPSYAQRAEAAAAKAEAVVGIDLATKTVPGLVSVGIGLSVDAKGHITVNNDEIIGRQGPIGPQGIPGPQGPQGDSAVALLNPRGDYSPSATPKYFKGDYVIYNNHGYVAKKSMLTINIAPTTGNEFDAWWQLFSVQGPKGGQGQIGPIGPQGIKGDRGDKGDIGQQGLQGPPGSGVQGTHGERGPQGLAGDRGDKGPQGSQGLQGAQGIKGDKGDKGDAGVAVVLTNDYRSTSLTMAPTANALNQVYNMIGSGGGTIQSVSQHSGTSKPYISAKSVVLATYYINVAGYQVVAGTWSGIVQAGGSIPDATTGTTVARYEASIIRIA